MSFLNLSLLLDADDLAAQVELSRADGNIWSTLLRGDKEAVTRIVNADPSQAMVRGAVGEVPLHMAFLYNSPKHQEIAVVWYFVVFTLSMHFCSHLSLSLAVYPSIIFPPLSFSLSL